jgi:predicted outer membrane repeat protein
MEMPQMSRKPTIRPGQSLRPARTKPHMGRSLAGSLVATLALLVPLLAGGGVSGASGAVWQVDPGGGGEFATIQSAILAAQSGDEIIVAPGVYAEAVDFLGKDLFVHSTGGPQVTVIDGSHAHSCVSFQGGETSAAVLSGFRLTAGAGTLFENVVVGGAVICVQASPRIENCEFIENTANYAAGIYVDQADPEVANCVFRGNVAARYGGGIAGPDARPSIHDCLFEDNDAGEGDGTIHLALDSPIVRCVFRGNEARSGGAINSGGTGADFLIQDCVFVGNRAHGQHGGAIRVHEATNVRIERCLFVDNTAVLDGGALFVIDGASPAVRGCTFDRNGASRYGGAVAIWSGSAPTLSNCIFSNSTSGGGVAVLGGSSPEFACDDAWENAGGNYVGDAADPTGQNGNLSADPIYCEPETENYGLRDDSPCAPDFNPDCGLVGAYDVACAKPTPVRTVTWGTLKSLFR